MYFNSTAFLGFLTVFLLLYFLLRHSLVRRNQLIVGASYFFYGWWDWRFTSLLLLSSLVDFYAGRNMAGADPKRRRRLLLMSLGVNLGALGFFKYYNFFIESATHAIAALGIEASPPLLSVILPVGISFYTFQSLSYTIDIYRRQAEPTQDLTAFLAYVSFFPQLVAGPIERASSLLPQFLSTRKITANQLEIGTWLILWGLFKKVVIADSMAPLVDMVYGNASIEGPVIILATLAFGLQIYCDFSGYSDIARGVAAILGFELRLNFNLPYTAITPSEFWRRWHISLSTWFRDYVYIPLGGNRGSKQRTSLNLMLTMLVAGLWHGAGWNFVLWGFWHGLILTLFGKRTPKTPLQKVVSWIVTMTAIFYGWLLFRAQSFQHIEHLSTHAWISSWPGWIESYVIYGLLFSLPLVLMELWQRASGKLMPGINLNWPSKTLLYGALLYLITLFWNSGGTAFIYFQF